MTEQAEAYDWGRRDELLRQLSRERAELAAAEREYSERRAVLVAAVENARQALSDAEAELSAATARWWNTKQDAESRINRLEGLLRRDPPPVLRDTQRRLGEIANEKVQPVTYAEIPGQLALGMGARGRSWSNREALQAWRDWLANAKDELDALAVANISRTELVSRCERLLAQRPDWRELQPT
ncbi:MAG TPA: hypothetical protein EYP56_12380 [Planctomycetaceae bacterium]|nr:hypothetical protein [Planctomycetaceae bacterium]